MRRTSFLLAMQRLGFDGDVNQENEVSSSTSESSDSMMLENVEEVISNGENLVVEHLSDIDVFEECDDSDDDSFEEPIPLRQRLGLQDIVTNSSESDDETELICHANGIQFSSQSFLPRLQRRNVLTQKHSVLVNPMNAKEAFLLFYNENIMRTSLRETNRKAQVIRRECNLSVTSTTKDFSCEECQVHYGVIIRAGLDRDNFTPVERLWNPSDSWLFYRIVTSKYRFMFFLRCLRFDNFNTRLQRQESDKLAAVRDLWTMFLGNLRRVHNVSDTLTVDEQLVGYRGSISGRTYMPSKPHKYGIKFFLICESNTGFTLNGFIYTGRDLETGPYRNLACGTILWQWS